MTEHGNGLRADASVQDAPVPWAQQATKPQPRATSRARRMVQDLPSWEPLPPGELLVHRNRRA
jgi:hypothetical protein